MMNEAFKNSARKLPNELIYSDFQKLAGWWEDAGVEVKLTNWKRELTGAASMWTTAGFCAAWRRNRKRRTQATDAATSARAARNRWVRAARCASR